MKKLTLIISFIFSFTTFANAVQLNGVNFGVSLTGGVFEGSGQELFSGDHVSNASSTNVVKSSEEVEALVGIGSVFVEAQINEKVGIGLDYVPHSLDSETEENVQDMHKASSVTNTVEVSFDDMRTIYALLKTDVGVYFKVGYTEVDVKTNENLGTGGKYGDTTLDGTIIGIGYNYELEDGMFVRAEGNLIDFKGTTLTNSEDSTKSIKAKDIEGIGARVSIGKSF